MKKPTFERILPLLESGEDFSLTETQYLRHTGATLPKDIYYLKNKSSLSKIAKKHGYLIVVKEKTICLKKASSV